MENDSIREPERDPADAACFETVERFCAFVGHPRSGHSVVGTLLNAHRHALISHNLDGLAYVRDGITRDALFRLILERDRTFAAEGRRMGDYSYEVPESWQGRFDGLRVIGDKRAGATSRHLMDDETLLARLSSVVGVPVTVVHQVRNPWDNIASLWAWRKHRDERPLADVADLYFAMLEAAERGLAAAGGSIDVVRTTQDDLLRDPRGQMGAVLDALHLPADEQFLDACVAFVHDEPRHTRFDVEWPAGLVDRIGERAAGHERIAHYRFEADEPR